MTKRVLAVDDSATMRQTVELTLKKEGYEVVTAVDGKDGLLKLDGGNEKFDCILTDVNMPNMDGITFCGEVRKISEYASIPVIIITTESQGDKKSAGKAAGATGWIVKPFQPEQLLGVLAKVCP
ncbi:MAG: response regulator [Planctomycetes bacterium]|nr:response regulator [Planctomycetota bacterium]